MAHRFYNSAQQRVRFRAMARATGLLAVLACLGPMVNCTNAPPVPAVQEEAAAATAYTAARNAHDEAELEEAAAASVLLLQIQLHHQRHATTAIQEIAAAGRVAAAARWPTAPSPSAERPQGPSQAFVFLFEWSWPDVAKECEDWLGPKGFTAALVSPPNEHNAGDSWFRRYQPVSYNLTSRSGDESQFKEMVQRCRTAGVGIYIDAVFNHCAPMSGTGVGGSTFGSRRYPMYGPEDFHHQGSDTSTNCGVSNYHDIGNVQYCDLQGMPDLCTNCPHVQETVAAYINHMGRLGIAGFRVDAAKHMNPDELRGILALVNSSLFRFLEVTAVPDEAVQTTPYFNEGLVTEFGYAAALDRKFESEGLLRDDFQKFGQDWGLVPSDKAVVFTDNHDTQRSGKSAITFKSGELYTLLNVFMLAYPYGYPKVMSSYRFSSTDQGPPNKPVHGPNGEVNCGDGEPWICEHRQAAIANMVAWRRAAGTAPLQNFSSDGNTMSFCRGNVACVALNRKNDTTEVEVHVSLRDGKYCDILYSKAADDCQQVVVRDGATKLLLPPVGGVALHANAMAPATEAKPVPANEEPILPDPTEPPNDGMQDLEPLKDI